MTWLLPEGVEELLPARARQLEQFRRRIADLFDSWGYDLVVPPLVEYFDSLVSDLGEDLARHTFKFLDPLSGRLLGIRADMTPQVARIAAHRLQGTTPVRLCYLGPVLRTAPACIGGLRNPFQVGAELYGDPSAAGDLEIITLMLETLALLGLSEPHLSLGHVGFYRGLIRNAALPRATEETLFDALQRKALPELDELVDSLDIPAEIRSQLRELPRLHGGIEILERAREVLAATDEVRNALATLQSLAAQLTSRCALYFDLGELRGYTYHTGVVFAAYAPGQGRALSQGGRYDGMGESRFATGFSLDLKALLPIAAEKFLP